MHWQVNGSDNDTDESDSQSMQNNDSDQELLTDNRTDDNNTENATSVKEETVMEEVRLRLRVASVNYALLAGSPELLAAVKSAAARQVAHVVGAALERVFVYAASGSLQLTVIIQVTLGAISQVRGSLSSAADNGDLASELGIQLSSIRGISAVVDGPIIVDVQSVDLIAFEANESNHTAAPTSRSSILADKIAFNLDLLGGTWLLCYRFAASNSSMVVGELDVLGAGYLQNGFGDLLEPVVNHEFDLQVLAPLGGLLVEDRLLISETLACGSSSMTSSVNGSLDQAGLPGSTADRNTSLYWRDLSIDKPGIYVACWCWSGLGLCSSDARYSLQLDTFVVRGPVSFSPLQVPAGHSFDLSLDGFGLKEWDRIRLANLSSDCGKAPFVDAEQLRGSLKSGAGDASAQSWKDLMIMDPGTYVLCWCAGSNLNSCSEDESFDFSLGFLDVWGPTIASHRCAVGSSCSIVLSGVPSYESSSILLRTGDVTCEGSISEPVSMQGLINPQQGQATSSLSLYSRFRFIPLRARSGNVVQLAELVLYFQGQQVDLRGAVAQRLPGGAGPAEEDPAFAIDGRRATKFLDFHGTGFELALASGRQVDAISYVTANDVPERDPVAFMLEGFSDRLGQ